MRLFCLSNQPLFFSQLRGIRNPVVPCNTKYTSREMKTTFTQKEEIVWRVSNNPSFSEPTYLQKISSLFSHLIGQCIDQESKYVEGYASGFKAGRWQGRKEGILWAFAMLGASLFLNRTDRNSSNPS